MGKIILNRVDGVKLYISTDNIVFYNVPDNCEHDKDCSVIQDNISSTNKFIVKESPEQISKLIIAANDFEFKSINDVVDFNLEEVF
jgi:hypothetical protein